ncbi:hypothetical protein WA026_020671 [Henosepilachna vigintioctopunctata]|uniref:Uncharacterized protein n=1 Tax=Henosepilachna vigintioctopunctata TaxID=420089 RepID=A0AAW1UBP8_9CUCU
MMMHVVSSLVISAVLSVPIHSKNFTLWSINISRILKDYKILETTEMSLNLNIPKIAITPEAEEDDDNNFLNLNEALTDIEELFDDTVSARRRSFQKKLKIKVVDTDGYNTAMEDIEASDDEEIVIIRKHSFPIVVESFDMEKYSTEENIEIAENKSFGYQHLNMKSSESNNSVDFKNTNGSCNMAAVTDAEDYDTENEIDEYNGTSEDEFNLNDYETMQAIRISDDMQQRQQAPSSSSITFAVPEVRTRRKPPTFSQIMKAKAVKSNDKKARRRKKFRVSASKSNHPEKSEESDSSEIESNERKSKAAIISMNSLNYESELEEDAQLPFPVCKKMFVKTKTFLQMPNCNVQDVTDTEDIECDIDLSRRRISVDNAIVQKQLDEMASCYSFTKDKNEAKDLEYESAANVPKMNIKEDKICKSKKQPPCSTRNNLEVVSNQDAGGTDIENIGSSSENEEPETQKDEKYFGDTEEEIFEVDFTVDTEDSPEVNLPPTTRTLIIAEESKSLVPTVRIFPLDEIILTESDIEIHSTDEESFNSVEEKEDNDDFKILLNSQLPNFEDGLVSVSENFIPPRHAINNIEETGTDIEDLYEENQKNMNGEIYNYKGQYLIPHNTSSSRTDSKKQNLNYEISGPSNLSVINGENEPFTDMENLESTDDEQHNPSRNKITHFNPKVMKNHTTPIKIILTQMILLYLRMMK